MLVVVSFWQIDVPGLSDRRDVEYVRLFTAIGTGTF
jgi:hypothetical protein